MRLSYLIFGALIFGAFACMRSADRVGVEQIAVHSAAVEPVAAPLLPAPVSTGLNRQLRLVVGPPEATLAVWTLEPAKGTVIRGSVLLLHGFLANHFQVFDTALALRAVGYRAIMVDLRGFGESTGIGETRDRITFGSLDATDMKQLIDKLQELNLCGPTLGVFGTSYGAATSILYAAADPRVTAVVAVAPFATIRDEVPSFARAMLGGTRLIGDEHFQSAADFVSRFVPMDLDSAKPLDAVTRTKAQILLIHGTADEIIPHAASEKLHRAAPGYTTLMLVPGKGHLDLCFDTWGELHAPTLKWFEAHLGK